MLLPLIIGGGLIGLMLFLKKKGEDEELKPGMVGLLKGTEQYGMVAINSNGILGWTNVLAEKNARVRSEFPNGARVTIVQGAKEFDAVANGDGPQGGRFFRAS